MRAQEQLSDVNAFWNAEACGTHFVSDSKSFEKFNEKFHERYYRTESASEPRCNA
jgi:hypothetical protein